MVQTATKFNIIKKKVIQSEKKVYIITGLWELKMETNKLLEIQGNVKDESNFFLKFTSIGFHLIVERV